MTAAPWGWPAAAAPPRMPAAAGAPLVAGIPNAHGHAFQRALLGRTSRRDGEDSFFSWREGMYRLAERLAPETLEVIAAGLYAELLEAGYTWCCEFHYLHLGPEGSPVPPEAMSLALVRAARATGMGLTLLPVLYRHGGFGAAPLAPRQRRFALELPAFRELLARLIALEGGRVRVGIAFHSLRAVTAEEIAEVLSWPESAGRPLHIHVAEQRREVEDCLAVHGERPVARLLRLFSPDRRWTLVHATHLDAAEVAALRRAECTVAVCPTTEADLGDGLPPLAELLEGGQGPSIAIGSDSQVVRSPWEELRWLEWGQRLRSGRRNRLGDGTRGVGSFLLERAVAGGWRAAGFAGDGDDRPEDLLLLDPEAPALLGHDGQDLAERLVFGGERGVVREVWAGGERVVAEGRHRLAGELRPAYAAALRALAEEGWR